MSTTMRDEIVRIKEGDLMDLRSRVNQLERENHTFRSVLESDLKESRERVALLESLVGDWPRPSSIDASNETTWP